MTEREANNRLKTRHEEYFKQSPGRITRYAAVIKDKDSENYLIEIAYPYASRTYDRGKFLNIKNLAPPLYRAKKNKNC